METRWQNLLVRIAINILWATVHKKRFEAPSGSVQLDVTRNPAGLLRVTLVMEQLEK